MKPTSAAFPIRIAGILNVCAREISGRTYSSRYIGSLVADFHRTLLKGGIFLYPPTSSHPDGKLRLLYEANPIAFIAEQAGGIATNGMGRILEIEPHDIHQRTPLVLGSAVEMAEFRRICGVPPERYIPHVAHRWYVAGFAWEFQDKPVARTCWGIPWCCFALAASCAPSKIAAAIAISRFRADNRRGGDPMRLSRSVFAPDGRCIEIPGQSQIPKMACVRAYPLQERNQIVWIWMGRTPDSQPTGEAPAHPWHDDPGYQFKGDIYHYKAPWQLIHDNLLDLSHLGYVHTRTIGGNASIHFKPEMTLRTGRTGCALFATCAIRNRRRLTSKPGRLPAASIAGRISNFASATFSSGLAV